MKISENLAELLGALMGDGHIYRKNRKYIIGFTGNIETDKEYFDYLKSLISTEWKKEATVKERSGGLRMTLNSKETCSLLIDDLGIPHGKGKCEKIFIPDFIKNDWNLAKRTIRGLVDTDVTVFVSKKPRLDKYPSIELTTTSRTLAEQVRKILQENGFRVAKIWKVKSNLAKRTVYRFGLNGQKNLRRWVNEIGFSNPWKMQRAISYLN